MKSYGSIISQSVSIPIERFLFGHDYWRTDQAIDEMMIYSDLTAQLACRIEALTTRGKDEEVTLRNVQAVLSAYALEIGMKSLWAMDNPDKRMRKTHNLMDIYKGLQSDSVAALHDLGLTEEVVERFPRPFKTNRYSMEHDEIEIVVPKASFLEQLAEVLRETLEKRRADALSPKPESSGAV